MLVGVDVGGTYTDAALISGGQIIRTAKVPTQAPALLECLLEALDQVLVGTGPEGIERIVFSTTLVTNLIAQRRLEPVALLLLPGPGVNPGTLGFQEPLFLLPGAVDYRGREIAPFNREAATAALMKVVEADVRKVAVVGKFSCRNHSHELAVAEIALRDFPQLEVELGHRVAGLLNFPRRAQTTRLTLATRPTLESFLDMIISALEQRGIHSPAFLLKADGGALPLADARTKPVEAIFSGPAASALGGLALGKGMEAAVILDVGGTTTDLALILNGRPLLASRGARVDDFYTQTRALAVRSLPIGGDSLVQLQDRKIMIGPDRRGVACCLGGPAATPTDAMRCLGLVTLGSLEQSQKAMARLGEVVGMSPTEFAEAVVKEMVAGLHAAVEDMFKTWEQEPAYRVWEIVNGRKGRPGTIIGVGGAGGLTPRVATSLGCSYIVPPHAASANAIGAALARPTVYVTLRADTQQGTYHVQELGLNGTLPAESSFSLESACNLARQLLLAEAKKSGAGEGEAEVLYAEGFNVVRDWITRGRIFDVVMQLAPGIVPSWQGGQP